MTRTSRTRSLVSLFLIGGLALAGCTAEGDTDTAPAASAPANSDAPGTEPTETEAAPEPISLEGAWEQSNKNSEDSYQAGSITGNTMQIDWVTDGGGARSVYWVGTVDVPVDATGPFTWESVRDAAATDHALLASTADTKTFTYDNGQISYEVTAMGTTVTVQLAPAG
jgi:hypothetical protein